MIEKVVDRMYAEIDDNRFRRSLCNGDKEVMYFKDFNSGAMIQNVVDRAKKNDQVGVGNRSTWLAHSASARLDRRRVRRERGSANTTNPMTGREISGRRVSGSSTSARCHRQVVERLAAIDTESNLGQYL